MFWLVFGLVGLFGVVADCFLLGIAVELLFFVGLDNCYGVVELLVGFFCLLSCEYLFIVCVDSGVWVGSLVVVGVVWCTNVCGCVLSFGCCW